MNKTTVEKLADFFESHKPSQVQCDEEYFDVEGLMWVDNRAEGKIELCYRVYDGFRDDGTQRYNFFKVSDDSPIEQMHLWLIKYYGREPWLLNGEHIEESEQIQIESDINANYRYVVFNDIKWYYNGKMLRIDAEFIVDNLRIFSYKPSITVKRCLAFPKDKCGNLGSQCNPRLRRYICLECLCKEISPTFDFGLRMTKTDALKLEQVVNDNYRNQCQRVDANVDEIQK